MQRPDKNTTLVLASHNKHKIAEMTAVLHPYVQLTSARELNIVSPDETGETCLENATIKARFVAEASGKLVLADDSGFFVEALDGFPGVITHDYVDTFDSTDAAYKALFERARAAQPTGDIRAYTFCVFVLVAPDGSSQAFEGKTEGTFVYPGHGDSAFGFDPYFIADGQTQSYAEMPLELKNQIGSRGRALQQFLSYIAAA